MDDSFMKGVLAHHRSHSCNSSSSLALFSCVRIALDAAV